MMSYRRIILILIAGAVHTGVSLPQVLAQPLDAPVQRALDLKSNTADVERALGRAIGGRAGDRISVQAQLEAKADARALDDKADLARVVDVETAARLSREESVKLREGIDAGFGSLEQKLRTQSFNINRFWVLLAALLVFFMQAGFKCLEVGLVRTEFGALQAGYKLAAWVAALAGYFVSFGFMFSASSDLPLGALGRVPHFIGDCAWCLPSAVMDKVNHCTVNNGIKICEETDRGMEFFLFQLAFAATAVTIPAGAIGERMSLRGYFILGLFISMIAYPLFGHWAWGGGAHMVVTNEVKGWLKLLGFHDFAGSAVVHTIGGCFAFVAARSLRRREQPIPRFNVGYAVLGVFLLWFGWWGFNGGSTLLYDNENTVPNIILHTNIAGATAGFAACALGWLLETPGIGAFLVRALPRFFRRGNLPEKVIGGALGGLVAITASCDSASPGFAFSVGLVAALVHNMAFDWLLHKGIDDPAGAVPVHAFCGVAGTLLVAFAPRLPAREGMLWVQTLGAGVAVALSLAVASFCILLLNSKWIGLLELGDKERMLWTGGAYSGPGPSVFQARGEDRTGTAATIADSTATSVPTTRLPSSTST